MDLAIIIALISLLATPLAAVVTWFFNRRKYNTDIYNVISESAQTSVETMQLTMNTLREELKDTQVKMRTLVIEFDSLKKDLVLMQMTINEKDKENVDLKQRIYMLTATIQGWANGDTPWE